MTFWSQPALPGRRQILIIIISRLRPHRQQEAERRGNPRSSWRREAGDERDASSQATAARMVHRARLAMKVWRAPCRVSRSF